MLVLVIENASLSRNIHDYEYEHVKIALMANLDKVPEKGAILVCTFPKPKGGSGFPARLFAIVP